MTIISTGLLLVITSVDPGCWELSPQSGGTTLELLDYSRTAPISSATTPYYNRERREGREREGGGEREREGGERRPSSMTVVTMSTAGIFRVIFSLQSREVVTLW